jgi:hypothetical protein
MGAKIFGSDDRNMEPSARDHASARNWIAPLTEREDGLSQGNAGFDPAAVWARLKEYDVPERVLQAVFRSNREMNDDALEYVEYLPPQASVLHVEYRRKSRVFTMELVLREDGPRAVFYEQKSHGRLLRCFLGHDRPRFNVALTRRFQPEKLTDAEIQEWFFFLLSGFKRLHAPEKKPDERHARGSQLFGAR